VQGVVDEIILFDTGSTDQTTDVSGQPTRPSLNIYSDATRRGLSHRRTSYWRKSNRLGVMARAQAARAARFEGSVLRACQPAQKASSLGTRPALLNSALKIPTRRGGQFSAAAVVEEFQLVALDFIHHHAAANHPGGGCAAQGGGVYPRPATSTAFCR
jgi:hypothetical protein